MIMRSILAAAAIVSLWPGLAFAHDFQAGGLRIHHPWTRATPAGAKVAVGYVSVKNDGSGADRLLGGSFEASASVEIHEMKMDGDVMRMRHVPQGIEIAPGATVELKPSGLHLMFQDLAHPLAEGSMIKGTLLFENAGSVAVEYKVEGLAAKGEEHGAHN